VLIGLQVYRAARDLNQGRAFTDERRNALVSYYWRYAKQLQIPVDFWAPARPLPHRPTFTIGAAAFCLGRMPKTIWNVLSARPDAFSPPRYRPGYGHPRRLRVLTLQDLATLADLTSRKRSHALEALFMHIRAALGSQNVPGDWQVIDLS
jgi:hypothetical protein